MTQNKSLNQNLQGRAGLHISAFDISREWSEIPLLQRRFGDLALRIVVFRREIVCPPRLSWVPLIPPILLHIVWG